MPEFLQLWGFVVFSAFAVTAVDIKREPNF